MENNVWEPSGFVTFLIDIKSDFRLICGAGGGTDRVDGLSRRPLNHSIYDKFDYL